MASCFQCQSQKQQEDPLCSVHCLVVCAGISLKYLSGVAMKSDSQGLPWWLSGWRSTCQCRRHRFNPWSRKIPQASEQLNPCTTICEPVLKGVWAATTEPVCQLLKPVNRRNHGNKEALCCSVTRSCQTLCNPMDCSMPGFPVLHHLPELVQTQVHCVGDAIQLSHHLSSHSPVFYLSQHQHLF